MHIVKAQKKSLKTPGKKERDKKKQAVQKTSTGKLSSKDVDKHKCDIFGKITNMCDSFVNSRKTKTLQNLEINVRCMFLEAGRVVCKALDKGRRKRKEEFC